MTDKFGVREDAAVAWLAFKPQLGSLLTNDSEEVLRLTFYAGFSEGWGRGTKIGMHESLAIIERVTRETA